MATGFVLKFVCMCLACALICFESEAARGSHVKDMHDSVQTCARPASSTLRRGRNASAASAAASTGKLVLERIPPQRPASALSSQGAPLQRSLSSPSLEKGNPQRSLSSPSLKKEATPLRLSASNTLASKRMPVPDRQRVPSSVAPLSKEEQQRVFSHLPTAASPSAMLRGQTRGGRWSQGDVKLPQRVGKISSKTGPASGAKPPSTADESLKPPQTFASLRDIVETVFPAGVSSTLEGFGTCFGEWANDIKWTKSAGSGRVVMRDRANGVDHHVWLHWDVMPPFFLKIYIGDKKGASFSEGKVCPSDQYTGAYFSIRMGLKDSKPEADLAQLGELNVPFAADSILKSIPNFGRVFTEWQIELLSVLRIPYLKATDASFFGDPSDDSISTMPLKLLQKGKTLYQGFYDDAFSFTEKVCKEWLENIRRMIEQGSEQDMEARSRAEEVMIATRKYSDSQDPKVKTQQWREAMQIYESLLESDSDIVDQVRLMLKRCRGFKVDVMTAMAVIDSRYAAQAPELPRLRAQATELPALPMPPARVRATGS